MAEGAKTNFENINDLIKAVIWPLIILLFFIFYGTEIGRIIKLVPQKIESSSKICVGSLTLEIEKTAKSAGYEELAEIIKNLSEKGLRKLLTLGSGPHSIMVRSKLFEAGMEKDAYTLPTDIDVLEELEKNGLVTANEPIQQFVGFFKELEPNETVRYKGSNGSSTDDSSNSFNTRYTELMIPVSKLSATDNKRIDDFGVELSESGRKAFEIIVHVIAQQISSE